MKQINSICIVDDHDIVRQGLRNVFTLEYGFEVVGEAASSAEAKTLIKTVIPDVLILDLLMPKMDGFAVIRELQSDPAFANLPIAVLTTVVEDASRRRYELETGRDLNVSTYLQKPVAPVEMLRTVAKLMEGDLA